MLENKCLFHLSKEQKIQENEYLLPYHYLDMICQQYKVYYRYYLHKIEAVKSLLEPFNGQFILDAGCGDGRFCYELRNENVNIIGIDYSSRAIAFAKIYNPTSEFLVGDLSKVILRKKVDKIVCLDVLEHIPKEHLPPIISNFHFLLKDKGELIITVPSDNLPVEQKHFQHFNKNDIAELLDKKFIITKSFGIKCVKSMKYRVYKALMTLEILLIPASYSYSFTFKVLRLLSQKVTKYMDKYYEKNC